MRSGSRPIPHPNPIDPMATAAVIREYSRQLADLPEVEPQAAPARVELDQPSHAMVQAAPTTRRAPGAVVFSARRMADVVEREVTWLWHDYIPAGKLTLFGSNPGMGKTWTACDLAARLTTGKALPDGSPAQVGSVLIMSSEDDPEDTLRPRLRQAGADLERVYFLDHPRHENGTLASYPHVGRDAEALEDLLREHRVALVIIDPLDAYLSGVDSHRNSDVRSALAPFIAVLERTGAACLAIQHLRKSTDAATPLHMFGGSVAFIAAARSAIAVVADQEDEDRRLFVPVKHNLCRKPASLAFRVTDDGVVWERDAVTLDVSEAMGIGGRGHRDSAALVTAKGFLEDQLRGQGWVVSKKIIEAAQAHGIGRSTLHRAREAQAVEHDRNGFGGGTRWRWPEDEDES